MHVLPVVSVSLLLASTLSASIQDTRRDPQGLFAKGPLKVLFDGGVFTEGPAHGPDGYLYFSDITFTVRSARKRNKGVLAAHVNPRKPREGARW